MSIVALPVKPKIFTTLPFTECLLTPALDSPSSKPIPSQMTPVLRPSTSLEKYLKNKQQQQTLTNILTWAFRKKK